MFFFQHTHGKLKTIVNKLMWVSRISGLCYAVVLVSETVFVTDMVPDDYRKLYCYSVGFLLDTFTASFWIHQLSVALLR